MIGRQVKICTGFTQSIQILRRKKIKKIYCPMTEQRLKLQNTFLFMKKFRNMEQQMERSRILQIEKLQLQQLSV